MKTKVSLFALAALAWCGIVRAEDAAASLMKVKSFAFGGIGVAGTTSLGEAGFRSILERRDALEQFRAVLSKGTNEAALYALCGIRALDLRPSRRRRLRSRKRIPTWRPSPAA